MNASLELIFTILSAAAILQGFLLCAAFLRRKGQNSSANYMMIGLILFINWLLFEFLLIRNKIDIEFYLVYGTRFGSWFLFGPFLFLYCMQLLTRQKLRIIDLGHFLPFLIFVILLPLFFQEPIYKSSVHYGMLTLFKYEFKDAIAVHHFYTYIFVAQYLHAAIYLAFSTAQLRAAQVQLKAEISNVEIINARWLKVFLSVIAFILLLTAIYFFDMLDDTSYRRHMDYIYMLPMVILIYSTAYIALRQPSIFAKNEKKKKYEQSVLNTEDLDRLKARLLSFMDEEQPYKNADLKLSDLAEALALSARELSQLINESLNKNFYDFVNDYRIRDAKAKLLNPEITDSILQIAYDVGFNNKTSFNSYFKRSTNSTPKQFRSSMLN